MKLSRFIQSITLLLTLMFVSAAVAQTVTGTITGEVTDPSGAVVSGAQVVAHNVSTGVDSPTTTNKDGFYRIQSLPIGHYEVTVQAPGFNKETIPEFSLEVLQTANFNVKLTVGTASTTMQRLCSVAHSEHHDPTLGATFTANTIRNFPSERPRLFRSDSVCAGRHDTAGTRGPQALSAAPITTDTPNINGNRAQANNYTLDGIDMNETFNNLISYSPAPEALAGDPGDYREFSRRLRQREWRRRGERAEERDQPFPRFGLRLRAGLPAERQLLDQQSTAGDLRSTHIPRRNSGGRWAGPSCTTSCSSLCDYLGSRYHKGGTGSDSVIDPGDAQRGFFNPAARRNPFSSTILKTALRPLPVTRGFQSYNPVANFLFANPSLYPLPNATPSDGIAANDYQGPSRSYKANNQGDIKIEYDPRASDKITGFYSMSTAYDGSTPVLAISFPGVNNYPTKLGGATWVHIFSPSLINSAASASHVRSGRRTSRSTRPASSVTTETPKLASPFRTNLSLAIPTSRSVVASSLAVIRSTAAA